MATFSAIISAITALTPVIIDLIKLYKEAKLKGWIIDGRALNLRIKEAKNDEERKNLALELFDRRSK